MSIEEQKAKLWCDAYLQGIEKVPVIEQAVEFADKSVIAFEEFLFNQRIRMKDDPYIKVGGDKESKRTQVRTESFNEKVIRDKIAKDYEEKCKNENPVKMVVGSVGATIEWANGAKLKQDENGITHTSKPLNKKELKSLEWALKEPLSMPLINCDEIYKKDKTIWDKIKRFF